MAQTTLSSFSECFSISFSFLFCVVYVFIHCFVRYELRLHKTHECGGAYLKILKADPKFEPAKFKDTTPFVIMFGPDKCGETDKVLCVAFVCGFCIGSISFFSCCSLYLFATHTRIHTQVHFIFRHENPLTHEWQEKHLTSPPRIRTDTHTHLYTLVIRPDNTFEIFIDQVSVSSVCLCLSPSVSLCACVSLSLSLFQPVFTRVFMCIVYGGVRVRCSIPSPLP